MLHITSLYAAILALIIIFLAYKVVVFRKTKKVGLGDNGDSEGLQAIRVHANAVEYIPMMIILMGLYEANGGNHLALNIIGASAVVARMMHAFGLSKTAGISFGRFYGTALTWLVTVVLAGLNIYTYFI
jgi:uncharacterized membrane protein YecN with MAPEG domain